MKKILFKKFSLDYLSFLTLTLISTGTVIWVFQAVNFLDIMIEDGRDYLVYIKFSLLNFPKIISKLFLFILFFSLFYIITKYEEKNELIIFWNFGVNKISLINYVLNLSILLLLFQFLLNIYLVPYSQDKARSYLRSSEINFYDNFIKPKKFNDTIKGLTIFTEKKDKDGKLSNLYIKKEINKNEFQITYAKKGEFKKIGKIPVLVLYDGATISSTNKSITNISFSKSDFSLVNLETNTTTYKKTQEISSTKLLKCIVSYIKDKRGTFDIKTKKIENCSYENIHNIFKEVYKRFITPFYIPVLSLISLFLIILSKENLNYQRLRFFTFSAGFLTIIFAETTIRLITKNFFQNIIFFSIPLILIFGLYIYLSMKFKYKFIN
ncbi:LptF/LptG family permease [Candidatus Pelagibacter sp.]|uniref:LptF/LptG family permease n=1 Tax=Candidatus Pelagibacter sp. TaxID=2024849 RepID=UPI003F84567B